MTKTGESYTAARRAVLPASRPAPAGTAASAPPPPPPPASEEAVRKATGFGWEHWYALLDAWGGTGHVHTAIARWLVAEQRVDEWWAQAITVGYERSRGMRAPGQNKDGWSVGATKTVGVPVETLFRAVMDAEMRSRWLAEDGLMLRTATEPKSARFDWQSGPSRVNAGFEKAGEGRSRLAIEHERLPDAASADRQKEFWRQRLKDLKSLLEAEPAS